MALSPKDSLASRYTVMRNSCLGLGSFGKVFKGLDNVMGRYVAVKEGICATTTTARQLADELRLLNELDHANIVRVFDGEAHELTAVIIMELMPGGSVQAVIDKLAFRFHENVVRRYFRAALHGLAYLHAKNIIHRDIKPANMLLTVDGDVKLADFGISKRLSAASATHSMSPAGTPCYMAPEVVRANKAAPASDIWSVACSALHMASGRLPWCENEDMHVFTLLYKIGSAQPPFHHPEIPAHLSGEFRALLQQCLAFAPDQRPSAAEIIQGPYLTSEHLPADAESLEHYSAALADRELDGDESAEVFSPVEIVTTSSSGPEEAAANNAAATQNAAERHSDTWGLPKQLVEFETDQGTWQRVADSIRETIQAYFDGLAPGSTLPARKLRATGFGRRYEFDFQQMTQRNIDTGKVRRLRMRRVVIRPQLDPCYLHEGGRWLAYDRQFTARIAAALNSGERFVQATVGSTDYEVDLLSLTQTNKKTTMRRLISLRESDRKPPKERAEYLSSSGTWEPFDDALSRVIVCAKEGGNASFSFNSGHSQYLVDFVMLTQTNVASGRGRSIRFTSLHSERYM
jgi:serine/threonine protein kinase